jgi:hypothetical protein
MKAAFTHSLQRCGHIIAGLWLTMLGLVLLFAFPLCGIAASLFVGAGAAWLVGGGTFGVVTLVVVAFCFGLFLSVYVWEPHVKQVVFDLAEVITKGRP